MALNFPDSPTDGQVFNNYYWDDTATVWRNLSDLNTYANFSNTPTDTYTDGFGYKYISFTANGTLTVTRGGYADVLLVGGGGGGGRGRPVGTAQNGCGGGAGGMLYVENYYIEAGNHSIIVGSGGNGATSDDTVGLRGGDSRLGPIMSIGGGGGSSSNGPTAAGQNGGSGGGRYSSSYQLGVGFPGQGNNGGTGTTSNSNGAGGGGGAGAAGSDGVLTAGGAGGAGLANSITGTSLYYAGGGGGGGGAAGGGAGGIDGGGAGSNETPFVAAVSGTANTGGGGGGTLYGSPGGNGGSGIVIVSVRT